MTTPTVMNLPIDGLREAAVNANFMPEPAFKSLVRAIRQLGFLQPILVRPLEDGEYEIVDGHHRVRAAREAGMTQVSAVVADPNNPAATAISMNHHRGELDLTTVGRVFQELQAAGWSTAEISVTGFSEREVADLLASVSADVDAALPQDISVPAEFEEEEDAPAGKPWVLEIQFENREDLKAARRGLKRAAGKGKDLARGLLALLGHEKEKR